jgi:hypothetical protein
MRKLLIGPALTGVGYAAGSYYGADAEQLVHKSPGTVQEAVEQALSGREGTMDLEGGKPVPYEVRLDPAAGDGKLTAHLIMAGRPGVDADVSFSAQDNGDATWRQYSASKPMIDPNADAKKYLNGGK